MASTSSVSFSFKVSNVSGLSSVFNTRQNVKKNFANIVYLESPTEDAVKLAYVGSTELSPENNIFIGDRSDELFENTKGNKLEEFIGSSFASAIDIKNKNFLVTQKFADSDTEDYPLYFRVELPLTIIPESVKLYDKDFNEVSIDKYKLELIYDYDEDTGLRDSASHYCLFNSLENRFDFQTAESELYFLQYTYNDGSSEVFVSELLNNEIAYQEATYSDYWYLSHDLKPWVFAYTLSSNLELGLPGADKYAVKYLEKERLAVGLPTSFEDGDPWHLKVNNGSFRHGYAGITMKYSVPEFENQAFNPIEPYKLAIRSFCTKVDDNYIALPHKEIIFGPMFSKLYIEVELDGQIVYAITNDSTYDGVDYTDTQGQKVLGSDGSYITWSTDYLLGFDSYSGIAHLDVEILDSYDIYSTYSYKEKQYALSSLVINPVFGTSSPEETKVIYVVPESSVNGNLGVQSSSIKWLRVSSSGVILSSNQDGSGNNKNINVDVSLVDSDGYQIEGCLGLHYNWNNSTTINSLLSSEEILSGGTISVSSTESFPGSGWLRALDTSDKYRYFKYTGKTDTSFTLSSISGEVPTGTVNIPDGNTVELVSFVNEWSTLTNRESSDEVSYYGGSDSYPPSFSRYFILAEVTINPPHGINDVSIIDVREDGGGVYEEKYEAAKEINPEVQWMNDFGNFDGQPHPGNATAVVKLPKSLLNNFTITQLKSIVEANIPYGIKPLLRFYGYKPRIVDVFPYGGNIAVVWEKEGPEFSYSVWYALNKNGPWTKHNDFRLTDDSARDKNLYVLDGLDENKIYYVKIDMRDNYFSWWFSYSSYNSVEGGTGLSEITPSHPGGNYTHFEFTIV